MDKRDYQTIKNDYDKAIKDMDINSIIRFQKELIESGIHSKGDWFKLAFFCGRVSLKEDFDAFMRANQIRLNTNFCNDMFGLCGFSDDFNDISTFYQIGERYPSLKSSDYDFLESYYTKSGTYDMIDEMLFDKDLLQRELKHYEPQVIDKNSQSFSSALLQAVFKAAVSNSKKYDIDELLETRYMQKFSRYQPVYVYNMETNSVELSSARIIDERTKKILGKDFSTIHLIKNHCRSICGSDKEVIDVLNEMNMNIPYIDDTIHYADAEIVWIIINKLSSRLGLDSNDVRIIKLENALAEEWLNRIYSENS